MKDQTGSRRFFIVRIPRGHIINVEWVKEHREQFWAQIHQDKSLKTYLEKPDEKHLQELNRGMYAEDDCLNRVEQLLNTEINQEATLHGRFRGYLLANPTEQEFALQPASLFRAAFRLGPDEQVKRADINKIAKWLNANGYTNKQPNGKRIAIKFKGTSTMVYVRLSDNR